MSVHSVHLAPLHGFSKHTQPTVTLLANLGVENDAHCGTTVQHLYDKRKTPDKPNLKQVHLIPLETLQNPTFRGHDGEPVLPGEMGENITTYGMDLHSLGEGYRLYFTHYSSWLNKAFAQVTTASRHHFYNFLTALLALTTALSILLHYRSLAFTLLLPLVLALAALPSLAPLIYKSTLPSGPIVRVTGLRKPCGQINDWRPGLMKQCYRWEGGKKRERAGIMGVVERGGVVEGGMQIVVQQTVTRREMRCV